MVESHEGSVDDDAQGDEEVDEGVEDDDGEELGQADVAGAAVPHAHHVHALDTELADPLFQPEGQTNSEIRVMRIKVEEQCKQKSLMCSFKAELCASRSSSRIFNHLLATGRLSA